MFDEADDMVLFEQITGDNCQQVSSVGDSDSTCVSPSWPFGTSHLDTEPLPSTGLRLPSLLNNRRPPPHDWPQHPSYSVQPRDGHLGNTPCKDSSNLLSDNPNIRSRLSACSSALAETGFTCIESHFLRPSGFGVTSTSEELMQLYSNGEHIFALRDFLLMRLW